MPDVTAEAGKLVNFHMKKMKIHGFPEKKLKIFHDLPEFAATAGRYGIYAPGVCGSIILERPFCDPAALQTRGHKASERRLFDN